MCSDIFKTVTNNNCSNNDVTYQAWKTMLNHISKYEEELKIPHTAENIWQNLRCWKCDEMWSSVFDTLLSYTSAPVFSIETKTKEEMGT